jgi:hypothetical protein
MCPAATETEAAAMDTSASASNKQPTATVEQASTSMSTSTSAALDAQTCTPAALAAYLIQQRFAGDAGQAAQFLQAAVQAAAAAGSSEGIVTPAPTSGPVDANENETVDAELDLGAALLAEPLVTSLLTPRAGKFSIQLYERGLVATHLKSPQLYTLVIPHDSVSHVVLFAKPEDCKTIQDNEKNNNKNNNKKQPKNPNAHLVLLKLKKPNNILFQKKLLDQVCFALSWTKATGPTGPKLTIQSGSTSSTSSAGEQEQVNVGVDGESPGWSEATSAWRTVLQQALAPSTVAQVHPNQASPFQSFSTPNTSSTTSGMPFVKCYHGVQDGVLYPLTEGLLFYKYVQLLLLLY